MRVPLAQPLAVAGKPQAAIDIRPPGRAVLDRIAGALGPDGRLPLAEVPIFAARMSGLPEVTMRRLSEADRVALREAIEAAYRVEARRQRARKGLKAAEDAP